MVSVSTESMSHYSNRLQCRSNGQMSKHGFQNVQARISDCQSTWSSVHHRALATFADHWSAQCTTIVSGVCPTLPTLPDHATSCLWLVWASGLWSELMAVPDPLVWFWTFHGDSYNLAHKQTARNYKHKQPKTGRAKQCLSHSITIKQ